MRRFPAVGDWRGRVLGVRFEKDPYRGGFKAYFLKIAKVCGKS